MSETEEGGGQALRRGWTTGSCATAATGAAFEALATGVFPDPVSIALPRGGRASFALALTERGDDFARAGVVKDAGDDPDVTHGALVIATVRRASAGSGVLFEAGPGVGLVTRPGLPIPPGEPAINPTPRAMMRQAILEASAALGVGADARVQIAIPGGEMLAERTLNRRLGIVGGLSILGTTGIVIPYSCAAWIDTIRRGVDVARAMGVTHIAGATGRTSELAVQRLYNLSDPALIDMGDFVGGLLKYLRRNPVPRISIAGGFGKMTKLAQGLLDLHSRRGAVDTGLLAQFGRRLGADDALVQMIRDAGGAGEALAAARGAGLDLADVVAQESLRTAAAALGRDDCAIETLVFGSDGSLLARAPFRRSGP